ncbi:NUDIX hydrolase [Polymorphobacter multimanifer]|uniref:8-oxo-dGTP pyrophosphatase MutT (NUDIX family) n=1 Tax=Polymorphobacter multimanifer TaxID=1070431 RepID=A0A841L0A0_9SPHN|nr:NUDIX hydrolase [Polymorphobacter multimanifer]MBB6226249.1 8-oxo-dGTP pyrophosphatase MutT (NUDIX family) [Polymorphobacter multimanifer]GGI81945.1 NUDIX hydrolase [Polymorphobacter multimanifer]
MVAAAPQIRPRDAATLIIIRRDGATPKVLMGRRVGGHAFMPDKWVFPGGRIHASDFRVAAASEPAPDTWAQTARTCGTCIRRARALLATAIRETFEETGLILGQPGQGTTRSPEWRDFLASGRLPHLEPLRLIGRAITPPARTRRFDARFFTVDARHLASLDPGAGSGELDEVAWFDAASAEKLDLPQITRALLAEALARDASADDRPIPFHRFRGGRHQLLEV